MKVQDVKSEYVIKCDEVYPTEAVQSCWGFFKKEEKEGRYEGAEIHARANATDVLNDLFESFEENGYEDMAEKCWDQVSDSQIAELQKVLDDICRGSAFTVITEGQKIDPK